jgi:carboxypeptidase C (cathepsin A)
MRRVIFWMVMLAMGMPAMRLMAVDTDSKNQATGDKSDKDKNDKDKDQDKTDKPNPNDFQPEQQNSKGSVNVEGSPVGYDAIAGTLVVHAKGWDDVPQNAEKDAKEGPAEASMFYVAYFKSDTKGAPRPLTFLFNGGPGSSTVWLHMGAFGPKRVVTADNSHTPAAPYSMVNNDYSLLDASDLVFVDAPGTGFSRITGKDKEKAFYGVDQDANAFAEFVVQFLTKYSRWNSPKYLFGESYGTPRAAVLVDILETQKFVDFNGVIMLSQILSFDNSADGPETNPGVDIPYELALPTYAATAWYHHKVTNAPTELAALLTEVEQFAMNDYTLALQAGSSLSAEQRKAIVTKLHDYTGLPEAYIEKANLRINVPEFSKELEGESDMTSGRLDSRFTGPTLDPLSEGADYDPQAAAIGSAYVSVFNDYVRKDLKFTGIREFKPEINPGEWNLAHQPPGAGGPLPLTPNVMPDLGNAMKYNPDLKIMLNGGYFDLATPFYEGIYEMHHLPIPAKLQSNIEYQYYESGHMVYAHEASLKTLHDSVAAFITKTAGTKGK